MDSLIWPIDIRYESQARHISYAHTNKKFMTQSQVSDILSTLKHTLSVVCVFVTP